MAGQADEAVGRFLDMTLPPTDEELLAQLRTGEAYWEQRRQAVADVVGSTALPPEAMVDQILQGEVLMPAAWQREKYIAAKRFAVEAVMTDTSLTRPGRFQDLAEIETGKKNVSGFMSHIEAIESLLERTPEYAPDGLILRLDFSDRDDHGGRNFIGATPHKVNIGHLGTWIYERRQLDQPYTATTPSFTENSGLHFRYATDVLDWQKRSELPQQESFRTYGLYTTAEDKTAWLKYGGFGWSSSQYPDRGPAVFWGQENIRDFIERMMTHGGERLAKIQADIGDFPGFEFIHDIEPLGRPGDDADDLAQLETA